MPTQANGQARPAASEDATVAALRRCALVAGLSLAQVQEIAARSTFHRVPAHRRVFEEGDICFGVWIVTAGRVRLHHLMADGRQVVAGFRAPSAPLDLASALDGRPHQATATTIDDSELVLVPRQILADLAQRYPVTMRNVIQLLCLEVRQRDITTAITALKDARGRVGCTLLQLARQFGVRADEAVRIDYRLTRQDVADRAGVTLETAIRVMSDLQQRGVIRTQAQVIEIRDVEQLRTPARCEDCQFDCSVFAGLGAVMAEGQPWV